ncbi:DUF1460 domain-containing protein [Massilia sp. PAMC28688]|uniref:N-acetylmuramoyl-L-alanine amidase-like domain-containing protein n=1 Tax=Massilia sp. PAMC28688 TaxID=2861283 RepID=UPI001C6286B6|nr:N-acetylmuramoyl-L-alanine amidase-like domain-containing protein [Massilia sp. PAMC28688]QYF93510.1 DUF1460 domain-containing protein [Massilia sp. PAMC28688]
MRLAALLLPLLVLAACSSDPLPVDELAKKPLFEMQPRDVHRYLAHVQANEPDLRQRIVRIGRQNIGQPYVLNLLGEYPFELHDTLPLFSLKESDCVVFAEHTYAMALSGSWEEFFWMLQRIRYKDGVIGVASRNHYTEVDWNVNNSWLVSDVTEQLAGDQVRWYKVTVDRARFLRSRHNTVRSMPVQTERVAFIGKEQLAPLLPHLHDGDMVNVVSARNGALYVSHVGLIAVDAQGRRNFLNSAEPKVREESFDDFFKRTAEREERNAREGRNGQTLAGFKLLRLNDNIVVPPALPQPRPR